MSKKKKKYQCVLSIYSTDDSKAETIYNELKEYFFNNYSNRITLNKLYEMTDVKRKREEKQKESNKRAERIRLIQENALKKKGKKEGNKKKPRNKKKRNKKSIEVETKEEPPIYNRFMNQD